MSLMPTDAHVITAEIARRMARYHRMPKHWEARRIEEMRAVEKLVDQVVALRAADGVTDREH